jgi:hypothetical protein
MVVPLLSAGETCPAGWSAKIVQTVDNNLKVQVMDHPVAPTK